MGKGKQKKNRRRWTALCLALLLSAGVFCVLGTSVYAAEGSDAPSAVIQAVKIASDCTLEVGIDLTCTDFRSAGAVLSFDRDKLKPIEWNTSGSSIDLPAAPGYRNAAPVAAKGADGLSGKPAMAFTVSGSALGYLYLGADSLSQAALRGQRVVTVRFAYVTEEGTGKEEAAGALTESTLGSYLAFAEEETAKATPVGGTFQLITQEKDADRPVYYTTGGGSGEQSIRPEWKLTEDGESMMGGGDAENSGYTLIYNLMGATSGAGITGSALEGKTFDEAGLRQAFSPLTGLKAGDAVTLPAIQLYRSGYIFKGWHPSSDTEGNIYQPGKSFTMPEGNVAFGAVMEKEGGAADSSAFASLTFYDWDETLLGTRIVAKGASLKDPNSDDADNDGNGTPDKADYETLLASATPEQIGENGHLLDSVLEENGFAPVAPEGNLLEGGTDEDGQPVVVKNKEGYLYAGWVDYETGHSTPVVENLGAAAGQTLPAEGQGAAVSLKAVTRSQVLKAGYNEDASKLGASAFERRYTLDRSAFYDSGTGYAATFALQRTATARRSNGGEVSLQLELLDLNAAVVVLVLPCGTTDAEQVSFTLPYDAMSLYDPDAAVTATIISPDGQALSDPLTIPAESIME